MSFFIKHGGLILLDSICIMQLGMILASHNYRALPPFLAIIAVNMAYIYALPKATPNPSSTSSTTNEVEGT